MRQCPKCTELNGENNTSCWKCGAALGPPDYKKFCRKCGLTYSSKTTQCEKCGGPLAVLTTQETMNQVSASGGGETWKYILSFLIPFVGIILGIVYIAKDDEQLGKSLIFTGIGGAVVFTVLGALMAGCM